MKEIKSKYLEIREMMNGEKDKTFRLINSRDNEIIGEVKKIRVGRFMHWCLWFSPEFIKILSEEEKGLFYTNGCLKEITQFITRLYAENGKVSTKE